MKKKVLIIVLAVITVFIMILSLTKIINSLIGMALALCLFTVFSVLIAVYANEQDIQLIKYVMIVFAFLGLFLTIFNIRAYFLTRLDNNYKFQIIVTEKKENKNLLFEFDNHKYYTYNLSAVDVIMKENEEKLSLKDALEGNKITLDEILSLAIPNNNTKGYKIYYDGGQAKYANDEYSIIVCDNQDIIFSTFNYTFKEEICS